MKLRVSTISALLIAFAICAAAKDAAAPTYDQKFLLDYFKQTRADFENATKGLSDAQWNFKSGPDRWSVAEVSEHIAKAEQYLSDTVTQKVMASPAATAEQKAKTKGAEEKVLNQIPDRSHKAQAPDVLQPTKKWKDRTELMKAYSDTRASEEEFITTNFAELRNHVASSPIGDLDAYEWMLFIAAHTKRHTAQILEVK